MANEKPPVKEAELDLARQIKKEYKLSGGHITKKRAMLMALNASLGIVSTAAKVSKVGRSTHYAWMNDDSEYNRAVKDIDERVVDFAEGFLYKNIREGDVASTIFFLKTKGRSRGYIEKHEVKHEGVTLPPWMQNNESKSEPDVSKG